MHAAGMGEAPRVGDWPGLEKADEPVSFLVLTRRRLRGRTATEASGSRAEEGTSVLDDERFEGIIASGMLAMRSQTSGRSDGSGFVEEWASDRG